MPRQGGLGVVGPRPDHVAHDDERPVAEHLFDEVDVFGGVCRAQVLAVSQYHAPAACVFFGELARQHLGGLGVKRVAAGHAPEVGGLVALFLAAVGGAVAGCCLLALSRLCWFGSPARAFVGRRLGLAAGFKTHLSQPVYVALAPGGVLAEAQPAAPEPHVERAVAQRYVEQVVAGGVAYGEMAVAAAVGHDHQLAPFMHAVARHAVAARQNGGGCQPQSQRHAPEYESQCR